MNSQAWGLRLQRGMEGRPALSVFAEGELRATVTLVVHEALLAGLRAGLRACGSDRAPWGLSVIGGGVKSEDRPEGSLWVAHGELEVVFGTRFPAEAEEAAKKVLVGFGEDHSEQVFGKEDDRG